MTIFVANVTTALTAVSLEIAPSNLAGLKVDFVSSYFYLFFFKLSPKGRRIHLHRDQAPCIHFEILF